MPGALRPCRAALAAVLASLAGLPALAGTTDLTRDVTGAASRVCSIFDVSGLLSGPCSVSAPEAAVDVTIDTGGGDAAEMCSGFVQVMRGQGLHFDEGWTLRIHPPSGDGAALAQCDF